MSNIYTYQVDHGEEAPSIGAKTIINGGECQSVAFYNLIDEHSEMQELLSGIRQCNDIDEANELIEIFCAKWNCSI